MVWIVGVRFKSVGKIYYFDPGDLDPLADCLVIKFPLHEAPPL